MAEKILLVEPKFPTNGRGKKHRQLIPLGLLKLASYHRSMGDEVKLVRESEERKVNDFLPHRIYITSIFTYWSKYVWDAVQVYKRLFPEIPITVGGIYATLMPDHCKKSGCDEVFIGIHKEAELFQPAYDLVQTEFQIINTSRGCIRNCTFCGVWKIEPEFTYKESIAKEIIKNRIIFYDNNFLANPFIVTILDEIRNARVNSRPVVCESQCGLDGRLLTPELARLLRNARLLFPRIAWDHEYAQFEYIKSQIDLLVKAGYKSRDIYVFMIYNYKFDYEELDMKRRKCFEWGVQIADCRYIPLNQTFDNYDPQAWKNGQTENDYFIHTDWDDTQIRSFRKKIREQNIVIRHGFKEYSREKELAGRNR
jgi:hypothetical protein